MHRRWRSCRGTSQLVYIIVHYPDCFGLVSARASWTLFAMAVLLLAYLRLRDGSAGFVSMSQFNLVSFPLFVTLAGLGLRAKWLLAGVIGLFGASLFMNTALACRIWTG
jgi:hypothetical protein